MCELREPEREREILWAELFGFRRWRCRRPAEERRTRSPWTSRLTLISKSRARFWSKSSLAFCVSELIFFDFGFCSEILSDLFLVAGNDCFVFDFAFCCGWYVNVKLNFLVIYLFGWEKPWEIETCGIFFFFSQLAFELFHLFDFFRLCLAKRKRKWEGIKGI